MLEMTRFYDFLLVHQLISNKIG